jgi:hypothetical protein
LPFSRSLLRLNTGVEGGCKWNKGQAVSFLQDASSQEKILKSQCPSTLTIQRPYGSAGGGEGGVSLELTFQTFSRTDPFIKDDTILKLLASTGVCVCVFLFIYTYMYI